MLVHKCWDLGFQDSEEGFKFEEGWVKKMHFVPRFDGKLVIFYQSDTKAKYVVNLATYFSHFFYEHEFSNKNNHTFVRKVMELNIWI